MNDDATALENRFVLFFDFLGASNVAKNWPHERVYEFVDLLISISQVQSTQDISGESQLDGSYRLKVTPEVTTFSDNVVVSYPSASLDENADVKLLESVWSEIVCKDAVRILSGVAEIGLRIGLLIRGGLSYGQLYHDGDVVFGEAMVDAYELEKKVAIYPRIVVSERIIAKLSEKRPTSLLLQDSDGEWHLNYSAQMVCREASKGVDQFARWKNAHLERINHEINVLSLDKTSAALNHKAKWEWFRQQFENSVSSSESTRL